MAQPLPQEQIDLAVQLKSDGMAQHEIAARLGVSCATVSRWLKPYKPSAAGLRSEATLHRARLERAGVTFDPTVPDPTVPDPSPDHLSVIRHLLSSHELVTLVRDRETRRRTGRPASYQQRDMIALVLVKKVCGWTWKKTVQRIAADQSFREAISWAGEIPSIWACYRMADDACDIDAAYKSVHDHVSVAVAALPALPSPPRSGCPSPQGGVEPPSDSRRAQIEELRARRRCGERLPWDIARPGRVLSADAQVELDTAVAAQQREAARERYGWGERPHRSQSVSAMASLDALLYDDGRDSLHDRLLGVAPALDDAYIQAETAATIATAIGALDLDRIERMDDASLGHLREKLRDAGLASHGVQKKERERLRTPTPHRGDGGGGGPLTQTVNRGSRKKLGRHARPNRKPRKAWQSRDKVVY